VGSSFPGLPRIPRDKRRAHRRLTRSNR
jgi:hypothetical protein